MSREHAIDLHEILTNRRHARHPTDLRELTSAEHWTREISELRQQRREGATPQARRLPSAVR